MKNFVVASAVLLLVIIAAAVSCSHKQMAIPYTPPSPPAGAYYKFTVTGTSSMAINYGEDVISAGQSVYGGPQWVAYTPRDTSKQEQPHISASGSSTGNLLSCSISDETGTVVASSATTGQQVAVTCNAPFPTPPPTTYEPVPDDTSSAPSSADPNINLPHHDDHHHVHVCVGKGIFRVCS